MDWYEFFQVNKRFWLIGFELLMIIYMILSIPLTVSLALALRRTDAALTMLYAVVSLIAVTFFISARPAFEMLLLSDRFAAAATEAQRSILLAAGEANIASSIFDFGLYIPVIGLYILIFSVLFLFVWDNMVARRLFQLARSQQMQPSRKMGKSQWLRS